MPKLNIMNDENEKLIANTISQAKKQIDLKNINPIALNTSDLHSYQRSVIQNLNLVRNVINSKINETKSKDKNFNNKNKNNIKLNSN